MSIYHQTAASFDIFARHSIPNSFLDNLIISTQMIRSTSICFNGTHAITLCVLDIVVISLPKPESYISSNVGGTSRQGDKKERKIKMEVTTKFYALSINSVGD